MVNNPSETDWVAAGIPGLFSVVIPARNEAKNLQVVVPTVLTALEGAGINHEILVVNDGSTDDTRDVLVRLAARHANVRFVDNPSPNGFGLAIRAGLANFRGEAVAIMMADGSDDPADLVKYHAKLKEGFDCVFGSRFIAGSRLIDYPLHKLVINRLANLFIRVLFQLRYNDCTNAFKCYRRDGNRGSRADPGASFQFDGRTAAESHHSRLHLCRHPDFVDQPAIWHLQAQDPRNGQPVPVHRALLSH